MTRWKASVSNHANWSVTRTMRVVPVIELFDEATQAKILAAASSHGMSVHREPDPDMSRWPWYRRLPCISGGGLLWHGMVSVLDITVHYFMLYLPGIGVLYTEFIMECDEIWGAGILIALERIYSICPGGVIEL